MPFPCLQTVSVIVWRYYTHAGKCIHTQRQFFDETLLFQLEEEVWLDEEQQELVEELKMEILEERRKQKEHNFDRGDEVRA